MRKLPAVLFSVLILSGSSAWAVTIYKCKNPEGRTLYQEKPCAQEAESVSSWASKSAQGLGEDGEPPSGSTLVIGQGRGGHYFVDGAVNDHFLNFIIDTGATVVSLPQRIADEAGIKCQGKAVFHTANGNSTVCTATIRELKVGNFTVRNVEAVFSPSLDQPLLGMNFLKRFRVEQDGGELRLSKKY